MAMIVALILFALHYSSGANIKNCPKPNIKFEKIIGLKPVNYPAVLLYQNLTAPITTECLSKCNSNAKCFSFVLFYKNGTCFMIDKTASDFRESDIVLNLEVSWFSKTCLKEIHKCSSLWTFERIPGATLIGNNTRILPKLMTRTECQQYCLNETSFRCRSAKFKVQVVNTIAALTYYNPVAPTDPLGDCILSNSDRQISPNSYRVSGYDDEYFENQCTDAIMNEFCAFEEFDNVLLSHTDLSFKDNTKLKCQDECERLKVFKCRGYSLIPTNKFVMKNPTFTCLIHSENSKLHGPKLLQDYRGAKYYERAPCLNITVDCTVKDMTIRFQPEMSFGGRIYMKGYSEDRQCYAMGNSLGLVTLKIPLLSKKCGIMEIGSPLNRTLMSTTLIIQYNAMVQTQADRIIKVGCIFSNSSQIVIGAGFNFTEDRIQIGSSIVNASTALPNVEMKILDLNTRGEVSDTQIGDELQLVIEMKPIIRDFDIWAGHLVAMTQNGRDSILLLDDRGCPTNLDVFPGLQRVATNKSIQLTSTFQAFKFSASNIIRFSVIVQFCQKKCPPVNCGGQTFYKRKRRLVEQVILNSSVRNVNRSEFNEEGMIMPTEMALEYSLNVRNANFRSDSLVYGENNRILVAGYDYASNEICIDFSLLIGIVVTWILIQIILLVSCIILIRKYKKYYENQCMSDSLEELHKNFGLGVSNLEANRRVHFADVNLT